MPKPVHKPKTAVRRSPTKNGAPRTQAAKAKGHYSAKRPQKPKPSGPAKIVLFNKPFDVLCQFTDDQNRQTLADYIDVADVYAAGRLDRDSEGLLLLTNDGKLNAKLTQPGKKTRKIYWVQVEGIPSDEALAQLQQGVELKDGMTAPALIERMETPDVWPRVPPVRERKSIADCWLKIGITEGRNRQVRRMTAAIGHPTLRLIRYQIGQWSLDGIGHGQWRLG